MPEKEMETPEQWAKRIMSETPDFNEAAWAIANDQLIRLKARADAADAKIAELTTIIKKADACDAWRAEALAAFRHLDPHIPGGSEYDDAHAARLAKGLT
jgi:hypothetical protein